MDFIILYGAHYILSICYEKDKSVGDKSECDDYFYQLFILDCTSEV